VLKDVRIQNAVRVRTLHSVAVCIVVNVLEALSSVFSQAVGRWTQHTMTETSVPTSLNTWSPNPDAYNFKS
jgi:hypothetical protein